jgi:hypothetical protein
MSFLKKNPLFCIVVALCVAACLAGVYMTLNASTKVDQAQRSLKGAKDQLSTLLNADPAPTENNLEAAQSNLNELQAELAEIREELQRGSALSPSRDGVSVLAGIQQYISRYQKAVANHKNEADETVEIQTPQNFAFGFKQYVRDAPVPEDPERIALLDKQRQILSYLLTQLIEADPQSITKVEREMLESQKEGEKGFSINPAISARVPGAIDTMAFSLTFTGYTDVLREFLNSLARFDLPIVVREIKVTRPSGSETVVTPPSGKNSGNPFSFFEEESSSGAKDEAAEGPKPVIEENISQFTIILEFIEVILPDTQTQEVSDPA